MYAFVSSTYLLQLVISVDNLGITFFSKSAMQLLVLRVTPWQDHPFEYTIY